MTETTSKDSSIEKLSSQIEEAPVEERFSLIAKRAKAYRLTSDIRAIEDYIDIVDGARDLNQVCHAQSMLALISILIIMTLLSLLLHTYLLDYLNLQQRSLLIKCLHYPPGVNSD